MSQHGLSDYDPTARTGTDLQAIFDAFQSGHIGTSRPSYATKGTIWFKEIGDPFTSIQEYLYDGSGDRLLREYFATGRIRTYFSNDGDQWIEADPSGNDLIIGAGNSARFQFTNDGDLIPETDDASDIGSASKRINQIFTAGGIYLGGTGVANFLKNYEEGTWTPSFVGGVTGSGHARQYGWYTRIGDTIHFEMDIQGSGLSGNGNLLQIGGLPFTSANDGGRYGGGFVNYQNQFFTDAQTGVVSCHVTAGDDTLRFYYASGNSFTGAAADDINERLIISGRYFVD